MPKHSESKKRQSGKIVSNVLSKPVVKRRKSVRS
jgi:hypothetical protein